MSVLFRTSCGYGGSLLQKLSPRVTELISVSLGYACLYKLGTIQFFPHLAAVGSTWRLLSQAVNVYTYAQET